MADIDAAIRTGLAAAWTVLAPRLKQVVYQRITQGAYNAATGVVTQTVTATSLRCFLVSFELEQVSGADILSSDIRAFIRSSDLPLPAGSNKKVDEGDRVVDHEGTVWHVAIVRGDPDFYFDLVLRR